MDAVVDYRSDACTGGEALPVESEVPRSSSSAREESGDGATRGLDESSQRDSSPERTPQEMDSDASLLPARCLQDVRKLLDTITSPKVTVKNNQERMK